MISQRNSLSTRCLSGSASPMLAARCCRPSRRRSSQKRDVHHVVVRVVTASPAAYPFARAATDLNEATPPSTAAGGLHMECWVLRLALDAA